MRLLLFALLVCFTIFNEMSAMADGEMVERYETEQSEWYTFWSPDCSSFTTCMRDKETGKFHATVDLYSRAGYDIDPEIYDSEHAQTEFNKLEKAYLRLAAKNKKKAS